MSGPKPFDYQVEQKGWNPILGIYASSYVKLQQSQT